MFNLNVGRLGRVGNLTLDQRIRALFAAGEQGVWYDPADFSTLFQDSAGATPVTAVGQPVGKILDKSGRGNHATQATSTKRPLLQQDATGRYYLAFDGVDDALATGSINFTATDKMTVVAGVRKLSDAAVATVVELSASSSMNAGSFALFTPLTPANTDVVFRGGGVAIPGNPAVKTGLAAPYTAVICGISTSGSPVELRLNGASAATGAVNTGSFGNYPLYIGSRGGTLLPFNGRIYSLIVRGAQSTDAQIAAAEAYCNQRTGAY